MRYIPLIPPVGLKARYQKRLLSSMNDVRQILIHTEGVEPISRYFCRIAAGMETALGMFRPFSARDSHVMHQLKQSAAGAVGVTNKNVLFMQPIKNKSVKYIKLIMDSALHAGKAARSPKQVPILNDLKVLLRNNNINGSENHMEISRRAEQQALNMAVEPSIENCSRRFKAMMNSNLLAEKYRSKLEKSD